jgi:hypothetical protein
MKERKNRHTVIKGWKTGLVDASSKLDQDEEEGGTNHHFIQENTQCPPVYSLGVPLALEKLGSNIFRGTTKS